MAQLFSLGHETLMDTRVFFIDVISRFLSGELDRASAARLVAVELPLGEVRGGQHDLLPNCEWGLRHIDEPDYWTTEAELRYYLQCLRDERIYDSVERDQAIRNVA